LTMTSVKGYESRVCKVEIGTTPGIAL
jgi:hypothetical protein